MVKGLRVVITAGGSGIGKAMAGRFLAQGAAVYICDVSGQYLEACEREMPEMQVRHADVSDPASVQDFFTDVFRDFGGIDVLVNNAGIAGPRGPVETLDEAEWDRCIRVNLSGMFHCIKQAVPAMKRQKSGCIINISSVSVRTALPMRAPYVAAKAGVEGLTRALARELGPHNIRCNAILPGLIRNERAYGILEAVAREKDRSVADTEAEFLSYVSMRSWIEPTEIGDMAVFLASDAARHISGQLVSVCGNFEWEP